LSLHAVERGRQLSKLIGRVNRERAAEQVAAGEFGRPTYFEATSALAFKLFADQRVDYAVIETGMGGMYDSTNTIARPDKLAKLAFTFENVLTGDLKPHIELERPPAFPSRMNVFTVPPRVLIDNLASRSHTVIEVNGRDRPGLLYEVTRELTRLNLQVSSAKISTYGEKVVDVRHSEKVMVSERIAVIGVKGKGKTTLLRILAILLPPYDGTIDWESAVKTMKSAPEQDLALTLELKEKTGHDAPSAADQLASASESLDRFEREWN